tara:strand:+ start:12764 stop:13516 length:753 start_codon:yes stop_codon:yes gene_type:complete
MKELELVQVKHNVKVGDLCEYKEPNILEDTLFTFEGKPIGFFIKQIDGKLKQFIEIANNEFRSKRVPKSTMVRASGVQQYSTIIGSVPPKPHLRRPYPSISSVHGTKSARTFIKAMLASCREAEKLLEQIIPEQYKQQVKLIEEYVPKKYRFGKCFTSSINNYNISAPFHRDTANIPGCVNVIINKKYEAKGGDLHVPDYNATMDGTDNSMLVYPAWRNVHGVTPITPLKANGYRNSLVFYPLASFKKFH